MGYLFDLGQLNQVTVDVLAKFRTWLGKQQVTTRLIDSFGSSLELFFEFLEQRELVDYLQKSFTSKK